MKLDGAAKVKLFLSLAKDYKRKVALFFLLVVVLPPLEVAGINLVYLMLAPEKAAGLLDRLAGRFELTLNLTRTDLLLVIFAATLVCVTLVLGGRLLKARQLVDIRFTIYEQQFRNMMRRYVSISGWAALKEDKSMIASLAVQEVNTIADWFFSILNLAFSVVSLLVLAASSLFYDPVFVLLAMALSCAGVLINLRGLNTLRDMGKEKLLSQREVMHHVEEILAGFEIIKFDSLERPAIRRMHDVIKRGRQWRVKKVWSRQKIIALADSFGLFSITIIAFVGIFFFKVDAALFAILLLIFNRLRSYVSEAQGQIMGLREKTPSVERTLSVLERLEKSALPKSEASDFKIMAIACRDLSFAYENELVFGRADLDLRAGDRVLVSGPSGEGKSSLLKLLAGYYPLAGGTVSLQTSQGEKAHSFIEMRPRLFYTGNDLHVFNVSVREVVDYSGAASDEEIEEALKSARLWDEVREMPDGLDTRVGPNGSNLSLGQRQRLLLSRFFLRNPDLVILDEATSNVDMENEKEILTNIGRHLRPEAILLVATHRQSSALKFNKIVDVAKGRVTQSDLPD